jgi:hypothetical protein
MRKPISSFCLALVFLAAPACSGTVGSGSSGAGGGASSGSSGAGGGASSGSSSGGATVQCTATPPVFPAFDKSCATPADCVIKLHMINCCGTQIAIGINASQSAAFDQAEALCDAMYPGCGCAQGPTKADDGKEATDISMIKVDCKAGACSTYIP